MNDATHPARFPEFLSRLHDRELSAAEASEFEAHRASCAQCRTRVDEFERTLSAYRAAPTVAPDSELAARILRKIRAQSPSRRPFGVTFGIDLRWAGIFAAALIVLIIGSSIVSRQRALAPPAPSSEAIPAYLLDGPAKPADALRENRAAAPAKRPAAPPRIAAEREKKPAPTMLPVEAPAAAGSLSDAKEEVAQRELDAGRIQLKAAPMARRAAAAPEPAGGEAAASSGRDTAAAGSIRLTVRALDGQGEAPALASAPPDERLAGLRGQEFVLTIETQGRVREVGRMPGKDKSRADLQKSLDSADVLREIRFQPGDRPRRLLVRVE